MHCCVHRRTWGLALRRVVYCTAQMASTNFPHGLTPVYVSCLPLDSLHKAPDCADNPARHSHAKKIDLLHAVLEPPLDGHLRHLSHNIFAHAANI